MTVCYKKKRKDFLFYQEMALKESLLGAAPHCSLFSVNTHTHILWARVLHTTITQAHLHFQDLGTFREELGEVELLHFLY